MFDSSHVLVDQGKVESEEHGDHNQHTKIHEVADDSQIIGVERSFKSVILERRLFKNSKFFIQ